MTDGKLDRNEGRVWSSLDTDERPSIMQSMDGGWWWDYIVCFLYVEDAYVVMCSESQKTYHIPENWIIV